MRRGIQQSRFVVSPAPVSAVRVVDDTVGRSSEAKEFPVRRVYCVGRNYAMHAAEMEARHVRLGIGEGDASREPPFFFAKHGVGTIVDTSVRDAVPYPPLTNELEFECELVVALKSPLGDSPLDAVGYYAVGCDLTRRDLQNQAKASRRPWDAAKSFDDSAPVGAFLALDDVRGTGSHLPDDAVMTLTKNGVVAQQTQLGNMIFNVAEALEHLGRQVRLEPGDVLFTGTPAGVGQVAPGDRVECTVRAPSGDLLLPPCFFHVIPSPHA
mmetsp:Transcript_15585/g.48743  ORF Transcript_15585/g.48743 Transcript_15585/m.48743 type:complete len:268 (+) Transcript_15585:42-845(+)